MTYLQAETRRHFPDADVETIYYTWAGVRALVLERSRSGMTESQVSRKDKIHNHADDGIPGLVTVLGGKITAYRAISEQLGNMAVQILGRGGPAKTADTLYPHAPSPSLESYTDTLRAREVAPEEVQSLVHTFGTAAERIMRAEQESPDLRCRIVEGAPETLAQVAYAAREEMAVTLADALLRRTGVGFGPRQGIGGLDAAARVMAAVHGWDAARITEEIAAYRQEIEPMRRFSQVRS